MGEMSKARRSGARMYETPSVGCCSAESPSKRTLKSLRSSWFSAERVCLGSPTQGSKAGLSCFPIQK